MAELVDAMVSNTIVFTDMPVRVRLGVQNRKRMRARAIILFLFYITLALRSEPACFSSMVFEY